MAKIILVTHQKGGVGKSTILFNLAANLKDKAKICIVDMDHQYSLFNLRNNSDMDIVSEKDLDRVMKEDYGYIFIDTPPYLPDYLYRLFTLADVIVIPTKAGLLELFAIRATIDILKKTKSENKALIVFNLVKPNTTLTQDIRNQVDKYDVTVSNTVISDLVVFSRSFLEGNVKMNSKAQKQIDDLTTEILMKMI